MKIMKLWLQLVTRTKVTSIWSTFLHRKISNKKNIPTQKKKVDITHNYVCRLVTGYLNNTPIENVMHYFGNSITLD